LAVKDGLGVFAVGLYQFVFKSFLYLPEGVAVADVFENQFTFFTAGQVEILLAVRISLEITLICLFKRVVHCSVKLLFLTILGIMIRRFKKPSQAFITVGTQITSPDL